MATEVQETLSEADRTEPLDRTVRQRKGPLAGVRVADFCWAGVGAVATRFLADFGAEVIKIESRDRLDITRTLPIYKGAEARVYGEQLLEPDPNRAGYFNNCNRNKLGVTLDLKSPKGIELAEQIITSSSIVTENFAPGVMERLGFTYERLSKLSPEVIYVRMSGWGHSGSDAHFHSYGPIAQAVTGLSFISGLPDREPSGWGFSYMDSQGAYYGAIASLMGIYRRLKLGIGGEVDISTNEIGVGLIGPLFLDVSVNRRSTRSGGFPTGNRLEHPDAAPHGVYPTAGEDRWIGISVFNEDQWSRLVELMGSPSWAGEERFATQQSRHANQDELDSKIAEWSAPQEGRRLMSILQQGSVPAGVVQDAQDVNESDPQLADRDVFFTLDHPVIGPARFEGVPFKGSRTGPDNWRSAPMLGEDNHHVFCDEFGMPEDEFESLVTEGVI
ncbi:MAG: CoA transferase [Acidimicrobiales bacterium]